MSSYIFWRYGEAWIQVKLSQCVGSIQESVWNWLKYLEMIIHGQCYLLFDKTNIPKIDWLKIEPA